MRIAFLTTDEPFYLPEFFRHLFENLPSHHEIRSIIVPPTYEGTSKTQLVLRYARTFGIKEAINLASRVIFYKIMDILPFSLTGSFYSLPAVFEKYKIFYEHVNDVNSKRSLDRLKSWKTDLIISISCPQIFKKNLIRLPLNGCLNLHGAILPKYRGVMPAFWVLANNENEAGSTLFFVNEKIDAGDILIQRRFPIDPGDTLDSFIRKSKRIGAEMVVEGIQKIDKGEYSTRPLDLEGGSYFGWPEREDVLRFLVNGRKFR